MDAAPGPRTLPLIGLLPAFRRDPLALLARLQAQYGDLLTLPLGPYRFLLVNEPASIHTILSQHGRGFLKGDDTKLAEPLLGRGLFLSEGETWRRQRRLVRRAFHREQLARYADVMGRAVAQTLARWRLGDTLDLDAEMSRIALTVAVRCFFGSEADDALAAVSAHIDTVRRFIIDRFRSLVRLPLAWPLPAQRRFQQALAGLGDLVERFIAERRAAGVSRDDLLGTLLNALDDPASPVDHTEVRDQAVSFLVAGSETTAATMTWAWYLLGRHPDVEDRVARELDAVLRGRSPTAADSANLPYLRAVILEALRLYPPVWLFLRKSTAPFSLGPYRFPANTQIMLSPWLSHRNRAFFSTPETFQPERWASGAMPPAFIPFGGGPRQCAGQEFALLEATLVMATIRAQRRFELLPPAAADPEALVTLRPRGGIPARVRPAGSAWQPPGRAVDTEGRQGAPLRTRA
jgi:cytochrome P450